MILSHILLFASSLVMRRCKPWGNDCVLLYDMKVLERRCWIRIYRVDVLAVWYCCGKGGLFNLHITTTDKVIIALCCMKYDGVLFWREWARIGRWRELAGFWLRYIVWNVTILGRDLDQQVTSIGMLFIVLCCMKQNRRTEECSKLKKSVVLHDKLRKEWSQH